jgi:hypothetical protein
MSISALPTTRLRYTRRRAAAVCVGDVDTACGGVRQKLPVRRPRRIRSAQQPTTMLALRVSRANEIAPGLRPRRPYPGHSVWPEGAPSVLTTETPAGELVGATPFSASRVESGDHEPGVVSPKPTAKGGVVPRRDATATNRVRPSKPLSGNRSPFGDHTGRPTESFPTRASMARVPNPSGAVITS